ncbi:MAG: hypothetical protein K8L97_16660 [Anaerolineae bacterium]|nr:hypothetical protein [Anaerolineae bacterium]
MTNDMHQALQHSFDRFTHRPQWLVLATVLGDYLGHVAQPNVTVEIDRAAALGGAAGGHHERITMEHGLGAVQFGLTVGDDGFVIAAFVGSGWVLCMKFTGASLPETLGTLPDALVSLVQLEAEQR